MLEWIKKCFHWKPIRDNNYYFGLALLQLGIVSLGVYLILDAYEPLAFLITFLICGWGFVLLWKSDNDLRFKLAQDQIKKLEAEIYHTRLFTTPPHLMRRYQRKK